ncbi:hypothetical protein FH972_026291 [Carpinus fangiana]|uniref:Major facilitator superfamily (MFS) profile domain-containing protein n=1 Tax=Carpinus fangiana TaxID=176857 RepID=A0A5N6L4J1_9ROSI|nr:hypothetical protein FH972_026291 [Carpinus fangiana]
MDTDHQALLRPPHEPLGDDDDEDRSRGPYINEHNVDALEATIAKASWFVWTLTFAAGVSGLLFGYDTGVISSTLISIGTSLSHRTLTTLDKSLITSATSFFALLVSPITGVLADALGRKRVIVIASGLFIVGAILQCIATTVTLMIVGRSVVGLAVGSASFVVPLYISELAPAPFRGRLVTVASLFITGGQVVAYVVGWLFSDVNSGWRWMVGLGAAPAILQLCLLGMMPETPRWLVKVGRREQAERVLRHVYGLHSDGAEKLVQGVLLRVQREVIEEEEASVTRRAFPSRVPVKAARIVDRFRELLTVGPNRRALTIACMLQGAQQLCGFNSLMYFSATIFAYAGYTHPTTPSLTVACTNFLFTLVAFAAIDRLGRRRILLLSIPVMAVGMVFCSIAFSHIKSSTAAADADRSELASEAAGVIAAIKAAAAQAAAASGKTFNPAAEADVGSAAGSWPTILLLATALYVASYALGLGCVPWQQSELFALSVRSIGSGLATATNWGANTIVGLTFLPLIDAFGTSGAFALYAGVCVASWFCVWAIYPETMGLGLEEVKDLLEKDFGVKKSVRLAQERSSMAVK